MAEQEKNFSDKSNEYADKYEQAIKEGAEAFKVVAMAEIAKGRKTVEQVLKDAQNAGIRFSKQTLEMMQNMSKTVAEKYNQTKDAAGQWVDDRVDDAKEARDTVVEGAAKTAGAVMAVGRLGKKFAIRTARGAVNKGREEYKAAKGTAQKAYSIVSKWFSARGKDIREAKDSAVNWVENKRDAAGQWVNDRVDDAREAKDAAINWAEDKRDAAGQWVNDRVDDAREAKDAAINWAEDKRDAAGQWANDRIEDVNKVKDTVEERALYGTRNVFSSMSKFFGGISDKLSEQIVSREEKEVLAKQQRENVKTQETQETSKEDERE